MKKVLPSFKFVLPTMLVVFAASGLSLFKTSSSSSAKAESETYDSWIYPDRSYYLKENNGTPVEVNKKTGDFDFVPDSDDASYLRYIVYSDIARSGAVRVSNAWPTDQWNTVYFNNANARQDYKDWGQRSNVFNNLSFNAGYNTFIVNMHYTYGIEGISLSDGLTIVNTHTPDVEGETYYATNLITEYSRLYYRDSTNNIFDPSFKLDRVIPTAGHPMVFTINNSVEQEYFLDLSSWSSQTKTIKYKIDNGSYTTISVESQTENKIVSVGNIGSGSHIVTLDTDENAARVGVRKLFADPTEKVTVSFNSNGGTDVASIEVPIGSLLTAPTSPTKSGNIFVGWFKDSELTQPWDFDIDTVEEDITLYAKWNQIQELGPSDIEQKTLVSGRHSVTDGYLTMDWGLSCVEFDITGGGNVVFNGELLSNSNNTQFAVEIDGELIGYKELTIGQNNIAIAENLSAKTHRIKVIKTTQAQGNLFNLENIQVAESAVIVKPDAKNLNIEIIGDSIAAGEVYLNNKITHNAYYGFSRHLMDAYDANVNLVATSGIGLIGGYNSGSPTTSNMMNSVYDYECFYRDSSLTLDTTKFIPDIIVINLGGNDLGSLIMSTLSYSINDFTNAVKAFNAKLHSYYPNAKIIWVYGEFINRGYLSQYRNAVEEASYASFVYTPKFGGTAVNVDDHPNPTEYKQIADLISTEISERLNEGVAMQYSLQNPLKQDYFLEAEEQIVKNGNPSYNAGENWSNDLAVANLQPYANGGYIEFNLNLTRTSNYKVRVGGTGSNGNLPLYIDGELVNDTTILDTSPSWYPSAVCKDYADIEVVITKGDHTFRLGGCTNGGWINHDYLEIIEVEQLACESYYQEFMKKTHTECSSSVSSKTFSSAIWDELKQSFVKLDGNNRDYLVDNYDDLIERYSLIIANYHLENFLVDSQNTPVVYSLSLGIIDGNLSSAGSIFVIVSSILITHSIVILFIRRRKHEN